MFAALPARAQDLTDMWWVPTESGWGINVVQSGDHLWITFFVYGSSKSPTWYSAYIAWDGTKYTGPLYQTSGSFFGGQWVPAEHPPAVVVGTATFQPSALNAYQATLSYTVTGVGTVVKPVERQDLGFISLQGTFVFGQAGTYSGCSSASDNSNYIDTGQVTVGQTAGNFVTLVFAYDSGATCTLSGQAEKHGLLFRMPGATYVCTGSLAYNTTVTVYELKQTSQGIEGRIAATLPSTGCQENASFSGVLKPF